MVCVLFYSKHHYCACMHLPLLSVSQHTHTLKATVTPRDIMANTIQNNTKATELSARALSKTRKCPIIHYLQEKLSISNSTEWLVVPHSGVSEPPKVPPSKLGIFHPPTPKMH